METEKTFADSKRTVCLGTGEAKFEVEYQESLPQYCEDVERVVRCVCSHAVTDYEYASGSLRVTGRSRISLVYISTSGCCHICLNQLLTQFFCCIFYSWAYHQMTIF